MKWGKEKRVSGSLDPATLLEAAAVVITENGNQTATV